MTDTDEKRHVVTIDVSGVRHTASVEARKLLVPCCGTILASPAPMSVATRRNAAPARSISMDKRSNPVRFSP